MNIYQVITFLSKKTTSVDDNLKWDDYEEKNNDVYMISPWMKSLLYNIKLGDDIFHLFDMYNSDQVQQYDINTFNHYESMKNSLTLKDPDYDLPKLIQPSELYKVYNENK